MYDYQTSVKIKETEKELVVKYPNEANYCSKASLWNAGLNDGSVSSELHNSARRYYGGLWDYCGD